MFTGNDIFKQLKWEFLKQNRKQRRLILVYKDKGS